MKPGKALMIMGASAAILGGAATQSYAGGFSFSIAMPVFRHPVEHCPPREPEPCKVWVPGHYEYQEQKVWVPGECERVWVPATCKTVWDGCRYVRVVCAPGHYKMIERPGRWECRQVKVWVAGYYEEPRAKVVDRRGHGPRGHVRVAGRF